MPLEWPSENSIDAASARVIQTADELLDILLSIGR
jgi:hypothetical protein